MKSHTLVVKQALNSNLRKTTMHSTAFHFELLKEYKSLPVLPSKAQT